MADRVVDLLAKTEEWLRGDTVCFSRMSRTEGTSRSMGILPSRLTARQKQELAKAEAILFELADKVTEKGPKCQAVGPPTDVGERNTSQN